MANLTLVTPIPPQTVVPGEVFAVSMHVHDDGSNFNWSGFTPKGYITVGTVKLDGTGAVVNAGGGTATVSWTSVQTLTLDANAWGTIVLYADPTSGSENRHIATIFARITAESIP
ncbi:hypothetical protein UFOVP1209_16 [uncultured Caudovirales phage]|uniref:Uncharacterized protein n=1 Tax=uncultured Caudovirales phage TaxID=2100421 RepID=A0A6J5R7R0_9CAUD|nr:hypothetical protein UFOVP1209_16 [uncultured Caudovirales phage]